MGKNNIVAVKGGYEASKHNATKHGILSRYSVMQWENREEYDSLVDSLKKEHTPEGATEAHLVEELAGIIWRKMRLKYAEMTSTQEALHGRIRAADSIASAALLDGSRAVRDFNIKQALTCTEEETQSELKDLKERLCYWKRAEEVLFNVGSYEDVLTALHPDDQESWQTEYVGARISEYNTAIYTETRDSLQHWILFDGIPYYEKRIYELESRDKVKTQALGQAFLPGDILEKYTRYENHLDRKFEKTLSMLIRLQELRGRCFIPAPKLA